MKWEIAILVAAIGGAVIGTVSAIYVRRETALLPFDRAMAGALLGAGAASGIFLLFSALAGLLYFFRESRSWWPVIALTWLLVGAFGGSYAFAGEKSKPS